MEALIITMKWLQSTIAVRLPLFKKILPDIEHVFYDMNYIVSGNDTP